MLVLVAFTQIRIIHEIKGNILVRVLYWEQSLKESTTTIITLVLLIITYFIYRWYIMNVYTITPAFIINSLYTSKNLFYISMFLHALFLYIFSFSTAVTFLYMTFDFIFVKIILRVLWAYLKQKFINLLTNKIDMPI